jgi:hypothetical protein
MKPLRILSPGLELRGEVDQYFSLSFIRRFHRPGEFQLVTSRKAANTQQLELGLLIMLGADPYKTGIIRHLEIETDEQGVELIMVKGETLGGITRQRITFPLEQEAQDMIEGPGEAVLKHYVRRNCLDIPDMAFPMLAIAPNKHRGEPFKWQSRYKNLAEELEKISLSTGLGWQIYLDFDLKKWVFDVVIGRDLTVHQDIHPPVIFSPEFENIKTQSYIDSLMNYANKAIVAGQGEGVEREIAIVGTDATDLNLYVIFVDARDVEHAVDLPNRGASKLAEHGRIQTFQSEVLTKGPFQYEKDWDLGDVVTVQNKAWSLTMNSRITEVAEIYEPGGFRLEVTFGNQLPTLSQKLRTVLDEFKNESTK